MRGLRHGRCAVVARVTNGNPVPITAANMRWQGCGRCRSQRL